MKTSKPKQFTPTSALKTIRQKEMIDDEWYRLGDAIWPYIEELARIRNALRKSDGFWGGPNRTQMIPQKGELEEIQILDTGEIAITYSHYRYGETDYDSYNIKPEWLAMTIKAFSKKQRSVMYHAEVARLEEQRKAAEEARERKKIADAKKEKEAAAERKRVYLLLKEEFEK